MKKLILLMLLFASLLVAQESEYVKEGEFIGVGWDNATGMYSIGIPADSTIGREVIQLLSGDYTFGGNTSRTNFYINGEMWTTDPLAADDLDIHFLGDADEMVVALTGRGFIVDWRVGDIIISQNLRVMDYPEDSTGAVIIEYVINNLTPAPADIGVLVILDTRVHDIDDPNIVFPDGTHYGDSVRYFRDDDVPEYWLEVPSDPMSPDTIYSAICDLSAGPFSRPDAIIIEDDRAILSTIWEPERYSGRVYGTAVGMWWDFDTLNPTMPGEAKIVQFPFGTATGSATDGQISVRHVMPTNVNIVDCEYLPSEFNFTYTVFNRTIFRMRDMEADILLPDGFSCLSDTHVTVSPSVSAGGLNVGSWGMRIDARSELDMAYPIAVTFQAEMESLYTDPLTPDITDTTFVMKYTTVYDTVKVPGSEFMPPEYELVLPFIGARSSLSDQEIIIYADDPDAGVDVASVDARVYCPSEYVMVPESTIFLRNRDSLIMIAPEPYEDGDMIFFMIYGMSDLDGCFNGDSIESWFMIDQTGPEITGYWPPTDSVCNDSLIEPYIEIFDNLSKVDPWSSRVEITDDYTMTEYYGYDFPEFVDIDTTGDDDDILYYELADIGAHYPDGRVDFNIVEVADSIHFGPANISDDCPYSWYFHVNAHGPRTRADLPLNGWYTSNANQDVRFYLYDGNGINESTVEYTIDGITLGWGDADHTDDSLHTYTPPGVWESGYVVEVEFLAAEDTFATPLDMGSETSYDFTVDLDPPVMVSAVPADDAAIPAWRFTVTLEVEDELAGLCHHNAMVTVNGSDMYPLDHPAVTWIDETHIEFVNDSTDYRPEVGEEIEICFTITDSVHVGEFNSADICLNYVYDPSGPEVTFLNTSGYLCSGDGPLQIKISDPDGVLRSSIEIALGNEDTLSISSPTLEFDDSILTYTPSPAFMECDTFFFCVLSVADVHTNWASGLPLCQAYTIDINPPDVIPTETYFETNIVQYWNIDGCSGVIDSTVIVSVDGTEFYGGDESIEIWDDSLIIFNSEFTELEFVEDTAAWYNVSLYYESICGDIIEVDTDMNWAVQEQPGAMIPNDIVLHQNVPNPFNASTVISFDLPEAMDVKLTIHDVNGKEIDCLMDGSAKAGNNKVKWDGTDSNGMVQSSGYYIYRIVTETQQEAKGMFLLK